MFVVGERNVFVVGYCDAMGWSSRVGVGSVLRRGNVVYGYRAYCPPSVEYESSRSTYNVYTTLDWAPRCGGSLSPLDGPGVPSNLLASPSIYSPCLKAATLARLRFKSALLTSAGAFPPCGVEVSLDSAYDSSSAASWLAEAVRKLPAGGKPGVAALKEARDYDLAGIGDEWRGDSPCARVLGYAASSQGSSGRRSVPPSAAPATCRSIDSPTSCVARYCSTT